MEEMIAHYADTKRNTFFSQLINLKQKVSVVEHIEDFQNLNIRVTDILEEHRTEKTFRLERKIECKIMATRKPTTHIYKDGSVATPRL